MHIYTTFRDICQSPVVCQPNPDIAGIASAVDGCEARHSCTLYCKVQARRQMRCWRLVQYPGSHSPAQDFPPPVYAGDPASGCVSNARTPAALENFIKSIMLNICNFLGQCRMEIVTL